VAIRILIVDDSALFRQGVRDLLETNLDWQVCGEAIDGFDGIAKTRLLAPHLIIMDLSMPRMAGIEAASEILKEFPHVPIVLLALYVTRQLVEAAQKVGIRATVAKTAMHDLADGIRALLHGEVFSAPVL
jgi:DNA-binding NarL/FixJ family response regulator